MSINILILCTYPIDNPLHGGQLRVSSIVDIYRTVGFNVDVAGVLGSREYLGQMGFVSFPNQADMNSVMGNSFLMEDYAISMLFGAEGKYFESLKRSVRFKPDIIHVEQPWLFPFAQRLAEELSPRPILLYGSQNIEHILKGEIVGSYLGSEAANQASELVLQCELNALKNADGVVAVSENDLNWMRLHSAVPLCLAPNGIKSWEADEVDRDEALSVVGGSQYALYCASAHPPNMTGFFQMFGGGFGSLNPRQRLVVAGGAGLAILQDSRLNGSAKLAERLIAPGFVSQPCLNALLEMAHCIVLPLTQGGGTNLKTAEALWSGKYVLATNIAMRGFEKYIGASGVHVTDEPSLYKCKLREIMHAPKLILSESERELRSDVLWSSTIRELPEFAVRIIASRRR